MTPAQETRKMIREFAQCIDQAGELALCLDAHLDDPDELHGLKKWQVCIVQRAVNEMLNLRDSQKQTDLRCWLEETEDSWC